MMDWFAWLSETELEPSLVYEYGLLLAQNELEEEDMAFFNHDFLQSMGIGVAKHRLEILKLAKRERGRAPYVHRLLASLKKSNRRVRRFVHMWLDKPQPVLCHVSSKVFSPTVCKGRAVAMKNRLLVASRADLKGPLKLKSAPAAPERSYSTRATPTKDNQVLPANSPDIWWASMFENLKPT